MMAVAQFRRAGYGQVLYGADDLSGKEWDSHGWQLRQDVRKNLFWRCAQACLSLGKDLPANAGAGLKSVSASSQGRSGQAQLPL